jgi:hypothetical protein
MSRNMQKSNKAKKNGATIRVTTLKRGATYSAPTAKNTPLSNRGVPSSVRFSGSERIHTVTVSTDTFENIVSIPIQAGLLTTFPWFGVLANSFEKYKVHRLSAVYHNLVGTQVDGALLMSFDYDVMDKAPTSSEMASQSTYWIDGAPWRTFELKIPTDNRTLFTRATTIANSDPKSYDMGRLDICTEGVLPKQALGYIELRYDITLSCKQPNALVHPGLLPEVLGDDVYIEFSGQDPTSDPHGYNAAEIVKNNATGDFTIANGVGGYKSVKGFKPDHVYCVTSDTSLTNNTATTTTAWNYVHDQGLNNVLEALYDFSVAATGDDPLSSWNDKGFFHNIFGTVASLQPIVGGIVSFGSSLLKIVDLGLKLLTVEDKAALLLKSAMKAPGKLTRKDGRIQSIPNYLHIELVEGPLEEDDGKTTTET